MQRDEGPVVTSDQERAELLKNYFSSVYVYMMMKIIPLLNVLHCAMIAQSIQLYLALAM